MNKKYIIIIAFLILQNKISPTDGWLEKTKAHFSRNKKKYITGLAAIGAGLYYKDAIANVLSNYFGSQKTVRVKTYQTDDEVNEVRSFLSETGPEENRLNNQLNLFKNQINAGKKNDEEKTEVDYAIERSQEEWTQTIRDVSSYINSLQAKLKILKDDIKLSRNEMLNELRITKENHTLADKASDEAHKALSKGTRRQVKALIKTIKSNSKLEKGIIYQVKELIKAIQESNSKLEKETIYPVKALIKTIQESDSKLEKGMEIIEEKAKRFLDISKEIEGQRKIWEEIIKKTNE